jgi:hypothetical protein
LWDDVLLDHESLTIWSTLDNISQEGALRGTSSVEYPQYIDPNQLTLPVNEFPVPLLSEINQYTEGVSTLDSQSQFSPNPLPNSVQQPFPAPSSSMSGLEQASSFCPNPRSVLSPANSVTQSASLSGDSHVSVKTPDGKKEISSTPSSLQYRQHLKHLSRQADLKCSHCGKRYSHQKNLERHMGDSRAALSCHVLKSGRHQAKPFVCTCHKSFSRKDSLQRHMNGENTCGKQQQH